MGMTTKELLDMQASGARFRIFSMHEAAVAGYISDGGDDGGWAVFEFEHPDDKHPRIVGGDGGEPEDQLLVRDWEWVVHALNAAYEHGRKDGAP